MEEIKIIKVKTKEDCEICDKFCAKLMGFESKLDSSILSNMNTNGFHEKALKQDNVFIAYAKANNPIGYIYGFLKNEKGSGTTTNRVFVDSLFVEESFRNKGVGKLLLSVFEDWAKEKYQTDYEIELLCLSNNQKALGFYQSLGYTEVKTTLRKPADKNGLEK